MYLVIHGPSAKVARARLQKVMEGRLALCTAGPGTIAVVASETEDVCYNPLSKTSEELNVDTTQEVRAMVNLEGDGDNFSQHTCKSCNTVMLANSTLHRCVQCGENVGEAIAFDASSLLNSDGSTQMKVNKGNVKPKKTHAEDEEQEQPTIEDLDEDEGDGEGDDEEEFDDTDSAIDDAANADADDLDSLDDEGEGEGDAGMDEQQGDEEEQEEADDDLGDDGMDDQEEGELDDEEEMPPAVSSEIVTKDRIIVTRPSLKRAAFAFGKKTIRVAAQQSAVASSLRQIHASSKVAKFNISGILAGECPICEQHTVADSDIKKIACQNCGTELSRSKLVHASMSADPSVKADDVSVETPYDEDEEEDEVLDDLPGTDEAGDDASCDDMEGDDTMEEEDDEGDPDEPVAAAEDDVEDDDGNTDIDVTTDEGDDGEGDDTSDDIEEIDLTEATEITANDKINVLFASTVGNKGNANWLLSVNNLPIATLARANVKGDLAVLAQEDFDSGKFGNKLLAAFQADPANAAATATAIGFVSIKIPAGINAIVRARTNKVLKENKEATAAAHRKFRKDFTESLAIAGDGIDRGFYNGRPNPIKRKLIASLQKAGVTGAHDIVQRAFVEGAPAYRSLLIQIATDLQSKAPEVRRELATHIRGAAHLADDEDAPADDAGDEEDTGVDQDGLDNVLESSDDDSESFDNGNHARMTVATDKPTGIGARVQTLIRNRNRHN